MKLRAIMFVSVAALASGCNTNTQLNKAVTEDRAAAMERCMRSINLAGPEAKSQLRLATGASERRLASVTCSRLFRGVQSGRITWADMGKIQRGQGTEIMKVLKGQ